MKQITCDLCGASVNGSSSVSRTCTVNGKQVNVVVDVQLSAVDPTVPVNDVCSTCTTDLIGQATV